MNGKRPALLVILFLQLFVLAACSSQQVTLTDPERDPWEAYNRKIHAFNMGFDKAIFRPVAKGYDVFMPDAPQRGIRNFFKNLAFPVTFLNLILQGKFEDSLTATGRFFMNTTVGLLGFVDVATKEDIPYFEEDFGQTLAVWGWKDSRYLVMPIFGPYTARDFCGLNCCRSRRISMRPPILTYLSVTSGCKTGNTAFMTAIRQKPITTRYWKNTDLLG
jgi:phospholipid-binding lipoprotein MlaA